MKINKHSELYLKPLVSSYISARVRNNVDIFIVFSGGKGRNCVLSGRNGTNVCSERRNSSQSAEPCRGQVCPLRSTSATTSQCPVCLLCCNVPPAVSADGGRSPGRPAPPAVVGALRWGACAAWRALRTGGGRWAAATASLWAGDPLTADSATSCPVPDGPRPPGDRWVTVVVSSVSSVTRYRNVVE